MASSLNALSPSLLDPQRLASYLRVHFTTYDDAAPLQIGHIRGGHSNETFFVCNGPQQWVLRRPPLGPLLPTAHDVAREYRVLAALAQTDVPVPRALLLCTDSAVLGAPFYLMEHIQGVVIRAELPAPYVQSATARWETSVAVVETLARLHNVDHAAAGLADFGRPTGYLERQLRRWQGQLAASRTRALPAIDAVTAWLGQHLPAHSETTLVHGDYRLDNLMMSPTLPPTILAVLDWEMATLGDPLADLGYLLSFWRQADDPPSPFSDAAWNITSQVGFASRRQIVALYASSTGRAVHDIAFYVALAIWKLAILLEGSYVRHKAGTTDDPFFVSLEEGVPALANRALAVCQQGTDSI